MTVQEMHDFFDLICDKVGSDYFTDNEKDSFLNKSYFSIVNDYVRNFKKQQSEQSSPPYSFETTSLISEVLQPLIPDPVHVAVDNKGYILLSDISTATGYTFMHLINIAVAGPICGCDDDFIYCRFVRHNDIYKHSQNVFKKPIDAKPVFRYFAGKIRINPASFSDAIVTILREPTPISLAGSVDCELPSFMHNEIMFRATTFSGISMRERDLIAISEQIKNENG